MANTHIFNEKVGLLKRGTIISYDASAGTMKVKLSDLTAVGGNITVTVDAPHPLSYPTGLFIGAYPAPGTPVVLGQGRSNVHYFVSFLTENTDNLPELKPGQIIFQTNDETKITLDDKYNIDIGSKSSNIHLNTTDNSLTFDFESQNEFTQGSRKVNGLVKRELQVKSKYGNANKLQSDKYDNKLSPIGLDPFVSKSSAEPSSNKNPGFIENRETIYEFEYTSNVSNDLLESSIYGTTNQQLKSYNLPNRRQSRTDTLSLSLVAPNFLMEEVKGTVIDIFGNILDLNRNPLPVGQGDATLRSEKNNDKIKSFLKIKELERKSLAYHFEINARKDLTGNGNQLSLPDVNSNAEWARNRSRFFIDIDKEGQFKINVPASSETGNIALLTRYENYSTFGPEDDGNPDKLFFRKDNLDIFQDSFAHSPISFTGDAPTPDLKTKGSIYLTDGDGYASPLDRIVNTHIKHGTAYHDILKTCYAHQTAKFLDYQNDDEDGNRTVDVKSIPLLKNVVSDTIPVSGTNPKAGGRSGSINFDGSLELNIGANTIDRQSLWLDTAGGIVANIGRDKNSTSAAISMNGDVYFQVGGIGVSGDSRFINQMNDQKGAVVDLRVFTDGLFAHIIRLDKNGVTIMTPGAMNIHSKGSMKLTSNTDIKIEAETVTVQGRAILKEFGGSI